MLTTVKSSEPLPILCDHLLLGLLNMGSRNTTNGLQKTSIIPLRNLNKFCVKEEVAVFWGEKVLSFIRISKGS